MKEEQFHTAMIEALFKRMASLEDEVRRLKGQQKKLSDNPLNIEKVGEFEWRVTLGVLDG